MTFEKNGAVPLMEKKKDGHPDTSFTYHLPDSSDDDDDDDGDDDDDDNNNDIHSNLRYSSFGIFKLW